MSVSPVVLSKTPSPAPSSSWAVAVRLLVRWIEQGERADVLLEGLPRELSKVDRARVQHLFFGALRHLGRLEKELERWVPHAPRTRVRAVIYVAGFELIEGGSDGHVARVVHHAVEQTKALASPSEARLVNAVVRKMSSGLAAPPPVGPASPEVLAEAFSHPLWMVRRWLAAFGPEATRALLEFHQKPGSMYARWRDPSLTPPSWLRAIDVPGFFELPPGRWGDIEPLLHEGRIYLQDPATRHAVDLLAPQPDETILDVCAAPGGKSLLIADQMQRGRLVAIDLPGVRIDRLLENLSRVKTVTTAWMAADLPRLEARDLARRGLPELYDGVLVDVPCSNTGVMRHRVDVKWRLQPGDFAKHARQQRDLLRAAARWVAPGGRLVYSTCSLESEENEQVVNAFLAEAGTLWTLEKSVLVRPWVSGHDGAGAFLLRKSG